MGTIDARRSAFVALLLLVPAPSVGTLLAMRVMPGPIGQAAYGLCKLWLLALPLVWTLWIDRGRLGWSLPRRGGLVAGTVAGVLMAGLILAAYGVAGGRWLDPAHVREAAGRSGLLSPGLYLAFAAYLVLVNSLLEEYVWRWFVFRKCEVLLPGWAAVLASAVFFTVHHVVALRAQFGWAATTLGSLGVLVGGLVWSWFYWRYRSIWPGYLCHAVVDVAVLGIGWRLLSGAGTAV